MLEQYLIEPCFQPVISQDRTCFRQIPKSPLNAWRVEIFSALTHPLALFWGWKPENTGISGERAFIVQLYPAPP